MQVQCSNADIIISGNKLYVSLFKTKQWNKYHMCAFKKGQATFKMLELQLVSNKSSYIKLYYMFITDIERHH